MCWLGNFCECITCAGPWLKTSCQAPGRGQSTVECLITKFWTGWGSIWSICLDLTFFLLINHIYFRNACGGTIWQLQRHFIPPTPPNTTAMLFLIEKWLFSLETEIDCAELPLEVLLLFCHAVYQAPSIVASTFDDSGEGSSSANELRLSVADRWYFHSDSWPITAHLNWPEYCSVARKLDRDYASMQH